MDENCSKAAVVPALTVILNHMRILVLILFIISSNSLFGQGEWSFKQKVDFDRYTTYQGTIDEKYPITMYLINSYESCSEDYSRWTPRKVYGWYMYDKVGKKIPLVGHVCYADACESLLELYVPEDPINYLFDENCNLLEAKEVFRQERGWDSNTFEWQMKGGQKYLVHLKPIYKFSWSTKANVTLTINNVDIETYSISELAENESIEDIAILGEKRVGDKFHLLFKYSHQSNPGSYGFGICGAGIEEFIAHLVVDRDFEVVSFKKIQLHSCIESFDNDDIFFDANRPELGIREQNLMLPVR